MDRLYNFKWAYIYSSIQFEWGVNIELIHFAYELICKPIVLRMKCIKYCRFIRLLIFFYFCYIIIFFYRSQSHHPHQSIYCISLLVNEKNINLKFLQKVFRSHASRLLCVLMWCACRMILSNISQASMVSLIHWPFTVSMLSNIHNICFWSKSFFDSKIHIR